MKRRRREPTQREVARLGGLARRKSLTPEQRSASARRAARARWRRYRERNPERAA